MARFVVGDDRSQSTLFPEWLDEYLGEDNPVRAGARRAQERAAVRTSIGCALRRVAFAAPTSSRIVPWPGHHRLILAQILASETVPGRRPRRRPQNLQKCLQTLDLTCRCHRHQRRPLGEGAFWALFRWRAPLEAHSRQRLSPPPPAAQPPRPADWTPGTCGCGARRPGSCPACLSTDRG
jgi:hypothetical protein